MKRAMSICGAALACVLAVGGLALGQGAPAAAPAGAAGGAAGAAAPAAGAPAAGAPGAPAAGAPGARGGAARGGRGGGRGGAPLSDDDKKEIAKLEEYPAWKPGAAVGNYSIGPEY